MKEEHKIFFAIPFDTATRNLYDRICGRIRKKHPTVTTIIGNEETAPSPEYSDFASFKAQNRELSRQFVAKIMESDVVVADLTHNNPNVHVELGIALMENKNILRVTGRSVAELGFDIQNLEVAAYQDEEQLAAKIEKYLDTFFKIKQLPISSEHAGLYREITTPIALNAVKSDTGLPVLKVEPNCWPDFKMRDGAIRVEFELLEAKTQMDWFGIFFRASDSPTSGSHLVYMRKDGSVEVTDFPSLQRIEKWSIGQELSGRQLLEIQFENDQIELRMEDKFLQTTELSRQTAGRVFPAVHDARADVHSMEAICRDTIEWNMLP